MKTKVRSTSIESYYGIRNLGARQYQVYLTLYKEGALSNNMVAHLLDRPINEITPRMNELVKMSVVCEAFRDKDPYTKKRVIYWKIKENPLGI